MLVPRAQVARSREDEAPWNEADAGPTVALCLAESAKAHLLGLELERAGIPYWWRPVPLNIDGVPSVNEFRVPAKRLEEARHTLARIEELGRSPAIEDIEHG